ncbi:GNAT family N-acetyltransferase [Roseibium sediminicola]|uniref:GNAT family N-acetyltransferase n=1 Tax=Roseibium sediminicola TaxID=2933272 RepID=A0ABT0GRC2_9HYPH|nr:GNAT family N-acetyltransferase [Roseibium sp. CAU 1639]MCK7611993.1 GNAT family N-acetyltransferase [Roseibium sp. CAU 1639]
MLPIELDQACVDAEAHLISRFSASGLSLQVGSDFRSFELFACAYDRELTEHFSVKFQAITPPRGFWMMLVAPEGEVVATVAARLDDLGESTLADYWKLILPIVYRDAYGAPVSLRERQPSFVQEATGRVIYLGEMWVHPDWRKTGIGSDLAKLVQLRAFRRFSPVNALYVWMRPREIKGGFASSCGFQTLIENAINWDRPPAERDAKSSVSELWLAGNKASALHDLVYDLSAGTPRGLLKAGDAAVLSVSCDREE